MQLTQQRKEASRTGVVQSAAVPVGSCWFRHRPNVPHTFEAPFQAALVRGETPHRRATLQLQPSYVNSPRASTNTTAIPTGRENIIVAFPKNVFLSKARRAGCTPRVWPGEERCQFRWFVTAAGTIQALQDPNRVFPALCSQRDEEGVLFLSTIEQRLLF